MHTSLAPFIGKNIFEVLSIRRTTKLVMKMGDLDCSISCLYKFSWFVCAGLASLGLSSCYQNMFERNNYREREEGSDSFADL